MADVMADPQVPAAPPAVSTLAALINRQLYLYSRKERESSLQNPDATVIADCNTELGVLSNQISALLPLEPQRLALEPQRLALEPQRLALEPQRLALEQQRLALEQQRLALEQQRLAQLPAQRAHELHLLQLQREERVAAAAANAVQEDFGMTHFAASHFAHEFRPDIRHFVACFLYQIRSNFWRTSFCQISSRDPISCHWRRSLCCSTPPRRCIACTLRAQNGSDLLGVLTTSAWTTASYADSCCDDQDSLYGSRFVDVVLGTGCHPNGMRSLEKDAPKAIWQVSRSLVFSGVAAF